MATPRTTVERTARRIQRQLSAGSRPEVNLLAQPCSLGDTVLTLTYPLTNQLIRPGALVEVDREMMRVMDVDAVNKKITVMRQWYDTEASDHAPTAELRINPRFSLAEIFDAMIEELLSWTPELFRVYDQTVAVATTAINSPYGGLLNYELPVQYTDMLRVLDVRRHPTATAYSPYVDSTWPTVPYRLQRGTVGNFGGAPSSGLYLRFIEPIPTGSLYVSVARPFETSTFELETDLVGDCGLVESMLDVLTMGVRIRLLGYAEHASSARDAQGASPSGEPVAPTTATRDAAALFAMYLRRRSEEANRLRLAWPPRNI